MRAKIIIALLLVVLAEAQAQIVPQVGWNEKRAEMPPVVWVGITAEVSGVPVACLSTDTPVSMIGLRRADISYRFVATTNLPHIRSVRFFLGGRWLQAAYDESRLQWEAEIPSLLLTEGLNLLRVEIRGRFNSEGITLMLFRISWRKSGRIEGQLTFYARSSWPNEDPTAFFYENGWVMLSSPNQWGRPSVASVSEVTETEGATTIEFLPPSSPIVFYWGGEKVEGGTLWAAPGPIEIRVDCPPGPAQIHWVRPNGERLTQKWDQISPPLIVKLQLYPQGSHCLIVEAENCRGELQIKVVGGGR